MSTRDHIWALVEKRLAGEATEEERCELDDLLEKYSGTDKQIKVIAHYWYKDNQEEIARRGALIFKKVKEKIKTKKNR